MDHEVGLAVAVRVALEPGVALRLFISQLAGMPGEGMGADEIERIVLAGSTGPRRPQANR